MSEYYFEDNRGLLYEIQGIARGGWMYAGHLMDQKNDAVICRAMFRAIDRNATAILELFDALEFVPGVGEVKSLKETTT